MPIIADMLFSIHKYIAEKWIFMRMAAQEFYFRQPFELKDEYPIMKSILFFALCPIELTGIFAYARIYGSLRGYTVYIILTMAVINAVLSNILINCIKETPFINKTVASYEQLDSDSRKKLYSFKNGFITVFLTVIVPWLVFLIGVTTVCYLIPHH